MIDFLPSIIDRSEPLGLRGKAIVRGGKRLMREAPILFPGQPKRYKSANSRDGVECCCGQGGGCDTPGGIIYELPESGFCISDATSSVRLNVNQLPGMECGPGPGWEFDPANLCGDPYPANELCWRMPTLGIICGVGTQEHWSGPGCTGSSSVESLLAAINGGYNPVRRKLYVTIEAILNPGEPEHEWMIFAGEAGWDGLRSSLPVTVQNIIVPGPNCTLPNNNPLNGGAQGGSVTFTP